MGIYLSKPDLTKNSSKGENGILSFGVSSMQGWRMSMEDAHISETNLCEGISIFAVFDGHGGSEVAKFCAKYFNQHLLANENFKKGEYKIAMEETFLKMDELLMSVDGEELLKEFRLDETLNSMAGCTANVVLFVKDKFYVANAGDSRAIIFTNDKKVLHLSVDHKPDDELEKQRINNAGGYVAEGRVNDNLNLSRAIGDLEYKKNSNLKPEEQIISAFPDVEIRELDKAHDFMIIGCDGIWETLSAEEICLFVKGNLEKNVSIDLIIEQLLDKLIAKETVDGIGCDNMSCIILKFKH